MMMKVTRIFIKGDPDDETLQRIYAKDVEKRVWYLDISEVIAYGEYHLNRKYTHIYFTTGDEFIIDMTLEEFDSQYNDLEAIDQITEDIDEKKESEGKEEQ
jgi:hypothetical protein